MATRAAINFHVIKDDFFKFFLTLWTLHIASFPLIMRQFRLVWLGKRVNSPRSQANKVIIGRNPYYSLTDWKKFALQLIPS